MARAPDLTGSGGRQRIKHLAQKLFHDTFVVHLSFFDGIGAASLAFLNLGIPTMSWEIDTECIAVLDEHFSPTQMGDITTFNIEDSVKKLLENVDHDKPIMIIATGGPPCPDFSTMRTQPTGASGATGHLFQHTVNILAQIKEALRPAPVHVLLEKMSFPMKT